jgi:hypothetical protein
MNRLCWRKASAGIGVAAAATLACQSATPAFAETGACASCDKSIQLTKSQLNCLSTNLDRYIEEGKTVSPIFFEMPRCSATSLPVLATKLPSDIRIVGGNVGERPGRFFVLSEVQLLCLRKAIARLNAQSGDTVSFDFSDCDQ